MRYKKIDAELFIGNRLRLANSLKIRSVAIVVANDEMPRNGDQYFPYRQNSDLFYLTGIDQEKTMLVLSPTHPDTHMREILFILRSHKTMETWNGHKLTPEEATEISGISTVKYLDELDLTLKELIYWTKRLYLAVNEYPKFLPEVETRDKRYVHSMKVVFPMARIDRLEPLISALRQKKQPQEIELIQQACDITNEGFTRVLQTIKPGMMEYEIEAELTYTFLRRGASGHAYQPVVASGKNSCVLHYISNDSKMNDGDLLLMDFGAEYANYAADCSRTIPVNGKFTPRQRACYDAVLRVFTKATSLYIPGNTINIVNKEVWKLMEQEMIALGLFSQKDVDNQNENEPLYFQYLMHGVCHPVGLDVHDVGGKDEPFKRGQVLTLEPGLYINEEKIGIRLENDIMVDDVPVDLMAHIPMDAEDIEKIMGHNL